MAEHEPPAADCGSASGTRTRVEHDPASMLEAAWKAWRPGSPLPRWECYLPAAEQRCTAELVFFVIHTDIEYRVNAGLPGLLAEPYFPHPRLQVPDACLDKAGRAALVRWEYEHRWEQGDRAARADYVERFPELALALENLKARWNCPHCQRLAIPLDDETATEATCPGCGQAHSLKSLFLPTRVENSPQLPLLACQQDGAKRTDNWQATGAYAPVSVARATTPAVPGYDVVDELGRGGMGVVYKAIQKATKRIVAVKVMLQGPFASARQQRRFEREVDLAASLTHPAIVTVYDSGVTSQGLHYFAMEFVEGVSLDEHLRARGPVPLRELLELFRKIAAAVAYAHRHGVIHRDLKPGNVRVGQDGEPHVLDFGLAKAAGSGGNDGNDQRLTSAGEFVGTLAYASPEQAAADLSQIDVRTDVYSLGVMLYQILTGEFPYPVTGRMVEVLRNVAEVEPVPPGIRQRDRVGPAASCVDEVLDAIVMRALAKDPGQRYQSADAFVEDVRRYLDGEPPDARPARMSLRIRSWLRRNFQTTLGIVAIGVVGGVVGALPRVLARNQHHWKTAASAIERFPDLDRSWLQRLVAVLPAWVLDCQFLFWVLGYGAVGILTALLVRPRSREEDVVAGMASGLVAGLAAFALGGLGWAMVLAAYAEEVTPGLEQLSAGYRSSASDPLGEDYPSLRGLTPEEQTKALRARITARTIAKLPAYLMVILVYSLSLGGACGVAGTMTAGCLLRARGSVRGVLLPYAAIALPGIPLTSGLLLWPTGTQVTSQLLTIGVLVAVTLLAVVRRWPRTLSLPLYVAGLVAWARFAGVPLPLFVDVAAASIALAAIVAQAARDLKARRPMRA